MEPLAVALIVIFVSLAAIPLLSRRTGVQVIVLERILGILLGASLLNIIPQQNQAVDFFSSFGIVYIMFLAGVEIDFARVRQFFSKTVTIALASLTLPFLTGFVLSGYAGLDPFFMGAIFSTLPSA